MSRLQPIETTNRIDLNRLPYHTDEMPRSATVLGIDCEGLVHFHDARREWVWIVAPDADAPTDSEIAQEADLSGHRVSEYVAHVETETGWAECRYHEGTVFEALADTLAEAQR